MKRDIKILKNILSEYNIDEVLTVLVEIHDLKPLLQSVTELDSSDRIIGMFDIETIIENFEADIILDEIDTDCIFKYVNKEFDEKDIILNIKGSTVIKSNSIVKQMMLDYLKEHINNISLEDLEQIVNKK